MLSAEKAESIVVHEKDDLYPYTNWAELYGDLDKMRAELIHECYEHLDELRTGSYCNRPISSENALEQAKNYQEEIEELQNLDINDKAAVLRVMRMHQKIKNAAEDFINQS
jgi:hypothetical protein